MLDIFMNTRIYHPHKQKTPLLAGLDVISTAPSS